MSNPTKIMWHRPVSGWPTNGFSEWAGPTIFPCEGANHIGKFMWHKAFGSGTNFGTVTPNVLGGWSFNFTTPGSATANWELACWFVYPKRFRIQASFSANVAGPGGAYVLTRATLNLDWTAGLFEAYRDSTGASGVVTDTLSSVIQPACFPIVLYGEAQGEGGVLGCTGDHTLSISIIEQGTP